MVAAALIPAAATVGIGIAWNLPVVAAGAALLLVSNFAAINVVAPVVLWLLGYLPTGWGRCRCAGTSESPQSQCCSWRY
jgi:uncharacterized membrane protein